MDVLISKIFYNVQFFIDIKVHKCIKVFNCSKVFPNKIFLVLIKIRHFQNYESLLGRGLSVFVCLTCIFPVFGVNVFKMNDEQG